jgi:hypothetical protein
MPRPTSATGYFVDIPAMLIQRAAAQLELIMTIGPAAGRLPDAPPGRLPDALEPGFQCVRTHWIRGFMGF